MFKLKSSRESGTNSRPSHQTKQAALRRIKESGIPVSCVIDVGVNESTPELIWEFPQNKHFLFEPISDFQPKITEKYREIDHDLYHMALSDICTTNYLVKTSLYQDGRTTHSQITDVAREVDGLEVTGCEEIDVRRFDELGISAPSNFLLKVDVDGKDLQVLKGFGEQIKHAAVVVIEITIPAMIERISYLQSMGFELVDFVDIAYYGNSIYQFDAVCVRKDLINEKLRPHIHPFNVDLWLSIK